MTSLFLSKWAWSCILRTMETTRKGLAPLYEGDSDLVGGDRF
jgi:hypothetical protein